MPARPERVAAGALVAGLALSLLLGVGFRDQIACGMVEAFSLKMIGPKVFADAGEAARDKAALLELARQAAQRPGAPRKDPVVIFTASSFWLGAKPTRTIATPFRSCLVIGPDARDELVRLAAPAPAQPAATASVPVKIDDAAGAAGSPNADPPPAAAQRAEAPPVPPAAPSPAEPAAAPSEPPARATQESAVPPPEPEPAKPADVATAPEPPKQAEISAPTPEADPPMQTPAPQPAPATQAAAPAPSDDPPPAKNASEPKAPDLSDAPTGSVPLAKIRPGRRFLAMRASHSAAEARHIRPTQAHPHIAPPRALTQAAPHSAALPSGWRRIDTTHGLLYLAGRGGYEGRCSTSSTNGYSICRRAGTRR